MIFPQHVQERFPKKKELLGHNSWQMRANPTLGGSLVVVTGAAASGLDSGKIDSTISRKWSASRGFFLSYGTGWEGIPDTHAALVSVVIWVDLSAQRSRSFLWWGSTQMAQLGYRVLILPPPGGRNLALPFGDHNLDTRNGKLRGSARKVAHFGTFIHKMWDLPGNVSSRWSKLYRIIGPILM